MPSTWKINVFQHGGDWERSRVQDLQNVHNYLLALLKINWACHHVAEILLIVIKPTIDLINRGLVLYMTVQRNVPRF